MPTPATYPAPSQADILDLMERAGWNRKALAAAARVGDSTVDGWLIRPGGPRAPSPMPAGLFELAKLVAAQQQQK